MKKIAIQGIRGSFHDIAAHQYFASEELDIVCCRFLQNHPQLKAVQRSDTASSARAIAEEHLKGHCAICHKDNAAAFGLKVLEEEIEDNKHNFTRFVYDTLARFRQGVAAVSPLTSDLRVLGEYIEFKETNL